MWVEKGDPRDLNPAPEERVMEMTEEEGNGHFLCRPGSLSHLSQSLIHTEGTPTTPNLSSEWVEVDTGPHLVTTLSVGCPSRRPRTDPTLSPSVHKPPVRPDGVESLFRW